MEDLFLLDAAERYFNNEMTPQEREHFESLRDDNPELDQKVVAHHLFLQKLNQYGDQKQLKKQLHDVHNALLEKGAIKQEASKATYAKVISFWTRYRRTVAVAASIAGITALIISGMASYISPKTSNSDIEVLKRNIDNIKKTQDVQEQWINALNQSIPKAPKDQQQRSAGTSFLVDAKGYLVTNSHVVNNAATLVVVNNGREYYAKNVYNDPVSDIAILKIDDKDFEMLPSLPYGIRKSAPELGEEIFTLGYPRNEIVYGKGYLSAQSGFNDDTLSVQISVDANPGNSGGPVMDKNGDVIGILNSKEVDAEGVVFANKSANILKALNKLKEDTAYRTIKLPFVNALKGKERTQQIKQIKSCVFMVKGYYK